MKTTYLFTFLLLLSTTYATAQMFTAQEVLQKSIEFHDPEGKWGTTPIRFELKETRPGGTDRETAIYIDLPQSHFKIDQIRNENRIIQEVKANQCSYQLNGSTDISEADQSAFRLNCERTRTIRDYYTYLWGLPMKLKDPGTIIEEPALKTNFRGQICLAIKVTYEEAVGKDTWYFYFHPTTFALIGYRFYHDEEKNDGEFITLEGLKTIKDIRIPRKRSWYVNEDDKFLGADILQK